MTRVLFLVIAAIVAIAALVFGVYGWTAAAGAEIGAHGWTALILGVTLTVAVGAGLMALVFYSSRYGYDERAHFEDRDLKP